MSNTNTTPDFYDVIVVGGGIHGAGAAQACAAAGYNCLLLEKNTWASATSSRSSKLLHGGLRYLQTGQWKLVRECVREREGLLRNAPQLSRINWFYLPIYQHSHYPAWKIFIGLSLYRLFAGFRNPHGRFKIIPRSQWASLDDLNIENLTAVFAYQDAQTDDKLLTHAVKNSAVDLGATAWENAELLTACKQHNGWQVDIHHNNTIKTVQAQMIINASGPWVNDVIQRCGGTQQLTMELVQGAHLVLQQQISEQCFYLEAEDHRAVFVLPWYGKTLVGTTETHFNDVPENTAPTEKETQYLLNTVKKYFPQAKLEISEQFSGLRVLPTDNNSAFLRQRDTRFLDDNGLISIYGGKLTAYRATAEKLLPIIQKYLGKKHAIACTRTLPLSMPENVL
jgi:glycerol-3-phosphate dehydrogenase